MPGGLLVEVDDVAATHGRIADGASALEFERLDGLVRRLTVRETADRPVTAGGQQSGTPTAWQTFLREELAPLNAEAREAVLAFLQTALNGARGHPGDLPAVSRSLHAAREALRERLPIATVSAQRPQNLSIDALVGVTERVFYVHGWCRDEESTVTRITAVSPEGARAQILDRCSRVERPDVNSFYGRAGKNTVGEKLGFIATFELPVPSFLAAGWLCEMESRSGAGLEVEAPPVTTDLIKAREAVLSDVALERPPRQVLISTQIHPAISQLQERWHAAIRADSVEQYGIPLARPECTILIPLYQRIDFVEHQLAQFAHDRELCSSAELLYVLDSPEQAEELAARAARLTLLYRMPFRVATLNRNGGYSAANNIGASLARGRLLLLLNSDVLPDRPGWLRTMTDFYQAAPGIGALGPKLVYEDDSLQHAGLYFSLTADGSGWENQHFFKGFHRDFPAANLPRPVPAVTGACLLIDSSLYQNLGGLRGCYVQGDFEDSDLCLRLIESGRQNWYLPAAELYHLEGQSYPAPIRTLTWRYNQWLHTQLWNARIEEVMRRYAADEREG